MRITHLISSFNVGGMEQFAVRLAGAQAREGHRVSVMAPRGGALAEAARETGAEPIVFAASSAASRLLSLLTHLRRERPELIHVHNATSLHYGAIGARVLGSALVLTHHGSALGPGRKSAAWEWRCLDAAVSVSAAAGAQLPRTLISAPVSVIHNGIRFVDCSSERDAVRSELGVEDRAVAMLVGRMDSNKGHSTAIQAVEWLVSQGSPIHLIFVGDGAERSALETDAARRGLTDRVTFLGLRSDVHRLLSGADMFLLPSRAEGLPLAMLEAMAAGLPCVATPVGGVPEVMTDGREGMMVPVGDPVALGEAMNQLAQSPALRRQLGRFAHERWLSAFQFEQMLEAYGSVYLKVLSGKPRTGSRSRLRMEHCR